MDELISKIRDFRSGDVVRFEYSDVNHAMHMKQAKFEGLEGDAPNDQAVFRLLDSDAEFTLDLKSFVTLVTLPQVRKKVIRRRKRSLHSKRRARQPRVSSDPMIRLRPQNADLWSWSWYAWKDLMKKLTTRQIS